MIVEIPDDNSNIKDLISRENLIRVIKTECNPYGAPTIDYKSGLRVLEIIDRAPTVVNEKLTTERPQGEWIIKPKENSQSAILICNKCNHFIPITIDKNFCPNCGADMRKEVKKNDK